MSEPVRSPLTSPFLPSAARPSTSAVVEDVQSLPGLSGLQPRGHQNLLVASSAMLSSPDIRTIRLRTPPVATRPSSSRPSSVHLASHHAVSTTSRFALQVSRETPIRPLFTGPNLVGFPGQIPSTAGVIPTPFVPRAPATAPYRFPGISSLGSQPPTVLDSSGTTPFSFANLFDPAGPGVPAPPVALPASLSLPPAARLEYAPFLVGPGIPPVSGKIVAAILSGQFIDLTTLVDDQVDQDSHSFSLLHDRLVLRPTRRKREFSTITAWLEGFNIYTLVLTAYHPHRITDLLRYSLFVLRTAQKFPGRGWHAYDLAFRKDAAARGLLEWSSLNPELFNFHVASAQFASVQPKSVSSPSAPYPPALAPSPPLLSTRSESQGTPASTTLCRSWNWGRCSSSYPICRFRHACDFSDCFADHRRVDVHPAVNQSFSGRPPAAKRSRFIKHEDSRR